MTDGSSHPPIALSSRHGAAENKVMPLVTDTRWVHDGWLYQATWRPCGWDTGCSNPVSDFSRRETKEVRKKIQRMGCRSSRLTPLGFVFLGLPEGWLPGECCSFSEAAGQEAGGPRGTELQQGGLHQRGSGQGRGQEGRSLPCLWRARFFSGLAQWETRGDDC